MRAKDNQGGQVLLVFLSFLFKKKLPDDYILPRHTESLVSCLIRHRKTTNQVGMESSPSFLSFSTDDS